MAALADFLSGFQRGLKDAGEFAVMRVLMARRAGHRAEMELAVRALRCAIGSVTLLAGYGRVRSFQIEAGGLVARERERGWVKAFDRMAVLATVGIRFGGKLPPVRIAVAIDAVPIGGVVVGIGTGAGVAFIAGQAQVLRGQREGGALMGSLGERGRPETAIGMAGATFAVVRAADELTFVLILVAVHALIVGDRRFEIRGLVTLLTGESLVFAVEREPGRVVFKGRG